MTFKIESGHRGLEGIATEGATGWDELGAKVPFNKQEDEDNEREQYQKEMRALLDNLNDTISELPTEDDSVDSEADTNAVEFENSLEMSDELSQSFGEKALEMMDKMTGLFGE